MISAVDFYIEDKKRFENNRRMDRVANDSDKTSGFYYPQKVSQKKTL